MKKTILLLAVAASMMAGMASCKKEETPAAPAITQTYDVSLRTGESYTFTLPGNTGSTPYEIISQPEHASINTISVNTSGEQIYEYTPEAGYSGTDQVIVSNDKEHKKDCVHPQGPPPPPPAGAPHGNCSGEKEDHYTVTINFTMKGSEISVSK